MPSVHADLRPDTVDSASGHVVGMKVSPGLAALLGLPMLLAVVPPPALAGVDELRLGLSVHDVSILGHGKEDGVDGVVEVLFQSLDLLAVVWSPSPHVGVAVNSAGDTSQLYAGLSWTFEPLDRVMVEFSLGGAVHDGTLTSADPADKQLGSRVLFRETLSLGYRFDEHHSLMVAFDHKSNARLADHNAGLNNVGIRWGYRF